MIDTEIRNLITDCIKAGDPKLLKIYDVWRNPFMPTSQKIYETFGDAEQRKIHAWQFTRRRIPQDENINQVFAGQLNTQARERQEQWEIEFFLTYDDGAEHVPATLPSEYEFHRTYDAVTAQFYSTAIAKEFTKRVRGEVLSITVEEAFDLFLHGEVHCHYAKLTLTIALHKFIQVI